MTTLRISTDDAINNLSRVIEDLQLLVDLCIATAVQNALLNDFAHVSLLILDVNCWSIIEAKTAIIATHAFVWRVLVVIETSDAP